MLEALYVRVLSSLCHGNGAHSQKETWAGVLNQVTPGFVGRAVWDRIRAFQ